LIYLAAKKIGCNPATIHKRLHKEPKLRQIVDTERETFCDIAEAKLLEAVQKGESWAVCFALKTQARKRGYIESKTPPHLALGNAGGATVNQNGVVVYLPTKKDGEPADSGQPLSSKSAPTTEPLPLPAPIAMNVDLPVKEEANAS
jgi:hypothetical protein